MDDQVCVVQTASDYPEYPYPPGGVSLVDALSALFRLWQRDPKNPFGGWIKPGQCAVIKPNWVLDYNGSGYDLDCLITHSSLIKYIVDFLATAMDGRGRVIIGDAPIQGCHFARLIQQARIDDCVRDARDRYPGLEVLVEDWRLTVLEPAIHSGQWNRTQTVRQVVPDGRKTHRLIDLGRHSFLEDIAEYADRFRVSMYNPAAMLAHHRKGKHEYLVTNRVADADLFINLPKLKTHAKAGLTGALKNVVGINGHKEYLPHHIAGSYFEGGDNYCVRNFFRRGYEVLHDSLWQQYASMKTVRRAAYQTALKVLWKASSASSCEGISSGAWSGNETIWRMTLDLNHLLYFSDVAPRKVVTIVDGIISGEGEGPLQPTPKPTGLLIAGENPACIDAVIAQLMGYNLARIPTVYHALYNRKSRFGGSIDRFPQIRCSWKGGPDQVLLLDELPNLQFVKPKYWRRAEVPCHL